MTYQEILKDLKAKNYKPIYFLHGKEAYFIDKIVDYVENNILSDAEKGFNQSVIYGKEADPKTVIDTASRYPMMAPLQVVLLKEAQDMKGFDLLKPYFENPVKTTVLVISYKHKAFNKFNTKFGKSVKAGSVVLDSKELYDNQVPDWISAYLKTKKLTIKPKSAALIGEYLGTSLSKISNELDKLALNVPAGSEVTDDAIEQNIGISKEYNVFEFQKALAGRNVLKANRIANYFAANEKKHSPVMVTAMLHGFFAKVYMLHHSRGASSAEVLKTLGLRSDWFLKDYKLAASNYSLGKTEQVINILKEYDLKSKGVDFNATGSADGALIKEMVYRIIH